MIGLVEMLMFVACIVFNFCYRELKHMLLLGAPDPTAGAGVAQPEPQWHLNEAQIREQVNHQLISLSVSEIPASLSAMCVKVREMLRVQDSNGARMLALMTDQCLKDNRLSIFKMRQAEMWPAYRDLWEELSQLWICVVLCPWISTADRQKWKQKLIEWSQREGKEVRFEIVSVQKGKIHKEFTAQVFVSGEPIGTGYGNNKKKAEQDAALKTCEKLSILQRIDVGN